MDTSCGSIDGSGGLLAVGNLGWGFRGRTADLDKRRGLGRSQNCGCEAESEREGVLSFFSSCLCHTLRRGARIQSHCPVQRGGAAFVPWVPECGAPEEGRS